MSTSIDQLANATSFNTKKGTDICYALGDADNEFYIKLEKEIN